MGVNYQTRRPIQYLQPADNWSNHPGQFVDPDAEFEDTEVVAPLAESDVIENSPMLEPEAYFNWIVFNSDVFESLIADLLRLNGKHYGKSLLGIASSSSIESPLLPRYKYYQGRHYLIADDYCLWIILDGSTAELIGPYKHPTEPDFGWYFSRRTFDGQYRYESRYAGEYYVLLLPHHLHFNEGFLSLAGDIAGLTCHGVIRKVSNELQITSAESLFNFNKIQSCHQVIAPAFEPQHRYWFHQGLLQSSFEYTSVFRYNNPNGSLQGFVQLYRHRTGSAFVPLTCWCHRGRHHQPQWVHFGFEKPMLFNLDQIEQYPRGTIYVFDNELLACNFENEMNRKLLRGQTISTTWTGGKHTLEHVDFSPLYGRRVVRVEENNNEASSAITEEMAHLINEKVQRFTIIQAEELRDGLPLQR